MKRNQRKLENVLIKKMLYGLKKISKFSTNKRRNKLGCFPFYYQKRCVVGWYVVRDFIHCFINVVWLNKKKKKKKKKQQQLETLCHLTMARVMLCGWWYYLKCDLYDLWPLNHRSDDEVTVDTFACLSKIRIIICFAIWRKRHLGHFCMFDHD